MENIFLEYLSFIGLPISKKFVTSLVKGHPDYPAVLSLSDTLHQLGARHKVVWAREFIKKPVFPFLLIENGKGSIVKNQKTLDHPISSDPMDPNGIALIVDPQSIISNTINNQLLSKEITSKYLLAVVGLIYAAMGVIQIALFEHVSLKILSVLSMSGVSLGLILISKDLGISSKNIERFCGSSESVNCDRVLKSDVSVFGLKLTDIVLTYFFFQFQMLTLQVSQPTLSISFQVVLTLLSLLCLPFVVFSIYYQYSILKTWCKLCLLVSSILILQAIIFLIDASYLPRDGYFSYSPAFIQAFTVALVSFVLIRGYKISAEMVAAYAKMSGSGNNVKHDLAVFKNFLFRSRRCDDQVFDVEVIVGNPSANVRLTMVTNLFCYPCSLKHASIDHLVKVYPESVCVRFLFTKVGRDPESVGLLMQFWHDNIKGKPDESENTLRLLHDWYKTWDFERFSSKYKVNAKAIEIAEAEEQYEKWAIENKVRRTPTFFLNGWELPDNYEVDDLVYLIPALIVDMEKATPSDAATNAILMSKA